MLYVKNFPLWERALRIGLGTAAAAYAALNMGGVWGWAMVVGGVTRFLPCLCPGWAPFGKTHSARVNADDSMSISEQHHSLLEAARMGDPSALDRLLSDNLGESGTLEGVVDVS